MTTRLFSRLAILSLAAGALSTTAGAQMASPIHFSIGGGATLPTGDAKDVFKTGWHGQVSLGFGVPMFPLGLRVDGVYHKIDVDSDLPDAGSLSAIGGQVNAIWKFPLASMTPIKPYLLGAVGMYRLKSESPGGDVTDTNFGLSGGGGVNFGLAGLGAFVEARYLSIFTEGEHTALIPITVGITLH